MEAPQNPAGTHVPEDGYGPDRRAELIADLAAAPAALRAAVAGLSDAQLDTRYRNWTIRQIVHHVADSHVNAYVRFKWTLTEDRPTIKPYFEDRWSDLDEARMGDIALSLMLLEALHARWVQLLQSMTEAQFARAFDHPESGTTISLNAALSSYVWHGRHHTAQVVWVRQRHGW